MPSTERVRRLLSQIAYDGRLAEGHAAAVGADGRWRLGNATGSWAKPLAEHIGATARDGHGSGASTCSPSRWPRSTRRSPVTTPTSPDCVPVAARSTGSATVGPGTAPWAQHGRRWIAPRRRSAPPTPWYAAAWRGCQSVRQRYVRRLRPSPPPPPSVNCRRDGLDALDRAVASFREVAGNWLYTYDAAQAADARASALTEQAARSEHAAAERAEEADCAEAELRRIRGRLEGLEQSVGADYRQIVAEIDQLRRAPCPG